MSNHVFDKSQWQAMPFLMQMGNIASEVGRAFSALRRGDDKSAEGAFFRGLDLIDASAEQLARQKSPRLKELLRAREVFATDYLAGHDDGVEQYFMQFAIAARSGR